MKPIQKSSKLHKVCYDIRGPVLEHAKRLEDEGQHILKLNIGNPAPFGFMAPDEVVHDVIYNLPNASGYCDSKGLFSARKAIMHYTQQKGIKNVTIEEIFLGNGVSELIVMSMQALVNDDDEILIPAPDYPLWTAAVSLAGGKPVHYLCDERSEWYPDLKDIRNKITDKTRAIVIINPNNPTGALYPKDVLEALLDIAREHNLIVFSDEIYDKILYDDAVHISTASLADDLVILTFNGLSKTYRVAGYRSGWLIISGNISAAKSYIQGLEMLASMRLCANVPAQHAIQTALGGYQSINELIAPSGRLYKQREVAYEALNKIPGVSCVKPKAAMYMFIRLDPEIYNIKDDEQLVLDFLIEEKVLLVQGTAFNWPHSDHLRIVFLPAVEELTSAIDKLAVFLEKRRL
ncbi:MAG: aminotransferase [Moraxellaceae bacterium]|nr:MAG: aminotransferase [Moraxellaceae bacterium]